MIIKKNEIASLYDTVKEQCKAEVAQKFEAEFDRRYKEELAKKIGDKAEDKSVYWKFRIICQKQLAENPAILISLSAILVSIASMFYKSENYVIAAISMLGVIVILVFTAGIKPEKKDKYRLTNLILDEIYKEKFEKSEK